MSHHMPWVDTLALNPLVVLVEYGCTGLGTTAPRTEPEAVSLAFTSATKRYGLFVRERNVKAVLKFTQRTPALVNEAPEFGFEFLAAE